MANCAFISSRKTNIKKISKIRIFVSHRSLRNNFKIENILVDKTVLFAHRTKIFFDKFKIKEN